MDQFEEAVKRQMFQRIAYIWKFLWKSREEQKKELARASLDVFDALAILNQAEKQELSPYVKDFYDDLMEINVSADKDSQ